MKIHKHAILITAYKDFNHLIKIISFFDDNFSFYIHIDKKSKFDINLLKAIKENSKVKFITQQYVVNWGGFNHLKSILLLCEYAVKKQHHDYYHLISGSDFPIKSLNYFKDKFSNSNKDYLDCVAVPQDVWKDNGGLDRYEYFNFYDLLNVKNDREKKMMKWMIKIQKRLQIKRSFSPSFPKIFAGSTWWSLTHESLDYVVNYTTVNQTFLNRFKYTFCSEEFYFQTILKNSTFASKIIYDNLRYIDWERKHDSSPAILDLNDFEKLKNTNAVFARKFDSYFSGELIQKIMNSLND